MLCTVHWCIVWGECTCWHINQSTAPPLFALVPIYGLASVLTYPVLLNFMAEFRFNFIFFSADDTSELSCFIYTYKLARLFSRKNGCFCIFPPYAFQGVSKFLDPLHTFKKMRVCCSKNMWVLYELNMNYYMINMRLLFLKWRYAKLNKKITWKK